MRKFFLFAVSIALLVSMGATVYAAPPPDGLPGLERAIEAQEAHTDRLLNMPGVVGTGVGLDENGLPVIRIYIEHAGVTGLPGKLDGVPAETVVTGRFTIREDAKAKQTRPVPIGVSTGHPDVTAGTIGARVKDANGAVYALSNNHVYANSNKASIGDSALQPGPYDGGTYPADSIGTLSAFEPIKFDGTNNYIDAAIVLSSKNDLGTSTFTGEYGYGTPNSNIITATVDMKVQKCGRTTGWTHGQVSEINVTVTVCYETRGPFMCAKSAKFVNQIAVTPGTFSAGGDSGSLIVTDDTNKNPVGLLFAGSSTHTIANPIGPVLSRFNVTIDDGAGDTPTDNPPVVTITSPSDGATFGSGVSISFTGTATDDKDGDVTTNLVWTSNFDGQIGTGGSVSATLSDGTHTITATANDSKGNTGSDSITITVGTSSEPSAVSVTSITYNPSGGRDGKKHLSITVALKDDRGNSVPNASVSIDVKLNESLYGYRTGTTGSDGTITFSFNNASSGTYTTTVTGVIATSLTWDGITPSNSFTK